MSESALVSIIVPVYSVEAYLPECIDSLLTQTYTNLEIILVDDESPDRCGEICDSYSQRDSRVKVIHKKNGGAASARNVGIEAAKGDYICFVDSDDVVLPEYIQHLYEHISQCGADIAVCSFVQFSKTKISQHKEMEPAGEYDRNAYLLQFLNSWTCSLLWNKIYRREIIGSLRMEEGHRIDDEFFTYQVVLAAKKVVVFHERLYQYRLRGSSVMRSVETYETCIMLDRIAYMQQRYVHVKAQAPELESVFFLDMLDSFTRYWAGCQNLPQVQHQIRSWANAHRIKILQTGMPAKRKLVYIYKLYCCAAGNCQLFDKNNDSSEELFD